MTPAEFKERMMSVLGVQNGPKPKPNADDLHQSADGLLLECLRSLGYGEGCDIYEQI